MKKRFMKWIYEKLCLLRHKRVIDRNVSDDGWGDISVFLVYDSTKDDFPLSFLQQIANSSCGSLTDNATTDVWFGGIAVGVKF
jgi:hypothetical protein